MVKVTNEGIILEKTFHEFESEGVLNPAAIKEGNNVHLYYRAIGKTNRSTIGYCRLEGPTKVAERWNRPMIVPEINFEISGCEDPRIVNIDDLYYLSYTGYDGNNARAALAISEDLWHFNKVGILAPPFTYDEFISGVKTDGPITDRYYRHQSFYHDDLAVGETQMLWDKDVVFFFRRIKGKLVFLHRIRPGIQIVSVDSLKELTKEFWNYYFLHFEEHTVMEPLYDHESSYVGSGCPPIETPYGWLLIYHGADETNHGIEYSACAAALLNLENPCKLISRLPYALFKPEYDWEKRGEVNNIVFPTGTALFGDTLYIYHGAAHERIAVASVNLPELVEELVSRW